MEGFFCLFAVFFKSLNLFWGICRYILDFKTIFLDNLHLMFLTTHFDNF